MLFNSVAFLIFLPTVLALYYALGLRGQNRLLLAASYLFYGWWDLRFLLLIVISTVVDYSVALLIERGRLTAGQRWRCGAIAVSAALAFVVIPWQAVHVTLWPVSLRVDWERFVVPVLGWWTLGGTVVGVALANLFSVWVVRLPEARRRKLVLACSIIANLAMLGVFKYFNFFVDSAETALASLGIDLSSARLRIVLPVGISFYTFQTMSYTIDVYRRELAATDRLFDFAVYVAYFPQLVAGPIERGRALLPQILTPRRVTLEHISRGCFLIMLGMFQKVAIADGVAASVNSVYGSASTPGRIDVIAATVLFAVQIYCDFAGYSNIARGTSKLMGIDLRVNFLLPYFSKNPSEFWRRWHISLSSWLRDYLYIPLGGNRRAPYRNLMLTMLLGGLWHGAAWNFVLWGAYQGGILCIHRVLTGGRAAAALGDVPRIPAAVLLGTLLRIGFFFAITCYGWLLFRAVSLDQIVDLTGALVLGGGDGGMTMRRPPLVAAAGLLLLGAFEVTQYATGDPRIYQRWPAPLRGAFYAALLLVIMMGTVNEPAQFIYFQF